MWRNDSVINTPRRFNLTMAWLLHDLAVGVTWMPSLCFIVPVRPVFILHTYLKSFLYNMYGWLNTAHFEATANTEVWHQATACAAPEVVTSLGTAQINKIKPDAHSAGDFHNDLTEVLVPMFNQVVLTKFAHDSTSLSRYMGTCSNLISDDTITSKRISIDFELRMKNR